MKVSDRIQSILGALLVVLSFVYLIGLPLITGLEHGGPVYDIENSLGLTAFALLYFGVFVIILLLGIFLLNRTFSFKPREH